MAKTTLQLARMLIARCFKRRLLLATAESCTGGLLAATLTEIPGCSNVLDRSFVTYSNRAKQEMLDVPATMLKKHGAVSRQTALAMVKGALAHSDADLAIAITGIAGPGGGSKEKPVGLVHFAAAARGGARVQCERRFGALSRRQIRARAVRQALMMLLRLARSARARLP